MKMRCWLVIAAVLGACSADDSDRLRVGRDVGGSGGGGAAGRGGQGASGGSGRGGSGGGVSVEPSANPLQVDITEPPSAMTVEVVAIVPR